MTNFEKVGIFMKTFGQEVKTKAELSNDKINELRISLINEELDELKKCIRRERMSHCLHAIIPFASRAIGAALGESYYQP